jgi:hypothetical protein
MKIYRQYFQKSKVFLYPLLGIAKGTRYVPKETYMAWKDRFTFDDVKLFCLYDQKITKSFSAFEEKKLLNNKFFYDYQLLDADKHLYIFDYSLFKNDWNKIMRGKYSKLSVKTKKKLLTFFGDKGKIAEYVESYIHPEYYFEDAAADLNVPQDSLVKLGELCSKPDFEKELLKIKQKDIPIVKNKSISLHSNNKIKEDAKEKPRRKFC